MNEATRQREEMNFVAFLAFFFSCSKKTLEPISR